MRILILGILCFIMACTETKQATTNEVDPYATIEDEKARAIIKRAIDYAGGLDRWNSIKTLKYKKDYALLLEDGSIEKDFQQIHDYDYSVGKVDISSTENGQVIQTVLQNGVYERSIDGTKTDQNQESLAKSMNSSTYVIGLPFKLLDPGAVITYEGERVLADGQKVDVIVASYDAAENENHSSSDTWRFYFDQENGAMVGNWIKTGDHFSLIENISFYEIEGLRLYKERKSFRTDSLGNKTYLRADYLYHQFEVGF